MEQDIKKVRKKLVARYNEALERLYMAEEEYNKISKQLEEVNKIIENLKE